MECPNCGHTWSPYIPKGKEEKPCKHKLKTTKSGGYRCTLCKGTWPGLREPEKLT